MNKKQLEQELMKAVDGLLMDSEIEAPFEFVYIDSPSGKKLAPEDVIEHAGKPSGMDIKVQELDEFMRQVQGIDSDARKSTPEGKAGYILLADTLNRLLQDIKVYSITQIGTEVYILGKAADGNYAGVRTMVIQGEATIQKEDE